MNLRGQNLYSVPVLYMRWHDVWQISAIQVNAPESTQNEQS